MADKKRTFKEVGSFNEEFHDWKESKVLEGTFQGLMEKEIDKEKRMFAVIAVEGKDKPQLAGGRDLVNKCGSVQKGAYVRMTFLSKETFTPKGTKKQIPINRYKVEVAE